MTNDTDPAVHRQRQQQLMEHIDRLLDDDRLRIDTTTGRRPIPSLGRRIQKEDHEVELIRLMSEMGKPDRQLQAKMPVGLSLSITLWKNRWFFLKQNIGQLKVVCVSPTRALLAGQPPQPMSVQETRRAMDQALAGSAAVGGPVTLVVMSTSGFAPDAHELAERRADRTVILVQPNAAGGWRVSGPNETPQLVALFDPESDPEKRQRIRDQVEQAKTDLLTGSLSADRIAGATQLPLELVESELKSYAAANPGTLARRLDGRLVLFREGALPAGAAASSNGGSDMPFLQRIKAFFSRSPDPEAKRALMAESRARLTQQRDVAYDEISLLEKKEGELKTQFKDAASELAKKRITGQVLQIRKDMERRQQVLGMLNQQINVISTQLHNIELVQQGHAAQLPTSEELADNAAEAEKIMADLQAESEEAGSLAAGGANSLSDEEQALYDELEGENQTAKARPETAPEAAQPPAREKSTPAAAPAAPAVLETPAPAQPQKRKGEAEPG